MMILTQYKDEIINFDNTLNVCLSYDEDEEYLYEIFAGMYAPDDNYRVLGSYKTKERAKEVLLDMFSKMKANGFDFTYEMPEE